VSAVAARGDVGAAAVASAAARNRPVSRFVFSADRWAAGLSAGVAGIGAVLSLQGAGSGRPEILLAGGGLLALGLLAMLVGGWIDGSVLVLLSLPLPALLSSESARLAPALLVSALVLAGWVLRKGTEPRRLELGPFPRRSTLLLLFAAFLSALFAQQALSAARELLNLALLLALLVLLTDELRHDRAKAASLPLWIALVGGVSGGAAVLQTTGVLATAFPMTGTSLYRATLGFGWPNEAGMFFALVLPFAVHAVRGARGRFEGLLGLVAGAGCLLGLLCTYSRGSWLAVTAAPAVLLLLGETRAPLRFWMAAAGLALALNLSVGGLLYERIASLLGDWVVEQRGALMLAGLLMFQAHPVVGVGPGGFGSSLEEFGPRIPWLWDYTGSAHNAYVHAAAEMGSVGVTAFVLFLGTSLFVALRAARAGRRGAAVKTEEQRLRETALWAFATACLVSFVEWPLAHGVGQLIMLVAALAFAVAGDGPRSASGRFLAAGWRRR
jgi:O-antigen ligase